MVEPKKRETAFKLRINDILRGTPIFEEIEEGTKRLKFIELGNRNIVRVNIIANVIDKYISEEERRFASIVLDDGSGQIQARAFGEDISIFDEINPGDTIVLIGVMRSFNERVYILPEIIKKIDPRYLVIRKLELEKEYPREVFYNSNQQKNEIKAIRDEIISLVKEAEIREGIDKEEIIMTINANPHIISQEIQKLLEEGILYEPKPGRVRYLG